MDMRLGDPGTGVEGQGAAMCPWEFGFGSDGPVED